MSTRDHENHPNPPALGEKPFRMPVEDVFSIAGRGTVASAPGHGGKIRSVVAGAAAAIVAAGALGLGAGAAVGRAHGPRPQAVAKSSQRTAGTERPSPPAPRCGGTRGAHGWQGNVELSLTAPKGLLPGSRVSLLARPVAQGPQIWDRFVAGTTVVATFEGRALASGKARRGEAFEATGRIPANTKPGRVRFGLAHEDGFEFASMECRLTTTPKPRTDLIREIGTPPLSVGSEIPLSGLILAVVAGAALTLAYLLTTPCLLGRALPGIVAKVAPIVCLLGTLVQLKGDSMRFVKKKCPACGGSGRTRRKVVCPPTVPEMCFGCFGSGKVPAKYQPPSMHRPGEIPPPVMEPCGGCGGTGKNPNAGKECPDCGGKGEREIEERCARCGGAGEIEVPEE